MISAHPAIANFRMFCSLCLKNGLGSCFVIFLTKAHIPLTFDRRDRQKSRRSRPRQVEQDANCCKAITIVKVKREVVLSISSRAKYPRAKLFLFLSEGSQTQLTLPSLPTQQRTTEYLQRAALGWIRNHTSTIIINNGSRNADRAQSEC